MFAQLIAHLDQAGRLPLLLFFLLLHLITFPLWRKRTCLPFLWTLFGNAGQEIARRLNRGTARDALRLRGRTLVVIVSLFALLIGFAVQALADYPFGWVFQFILLGGSVQPLLAVALLRQPYAQGAEIYTVRRFDIMLAADIFSRVVIAPSLFYLAAGPVGLCLSVAMLSLIAPRGLKKDDQAVLFEAPLRRINAVIMLIPSWLSVVILSAGSLFVSGGNSLHAFRMLSAVRWHDSFGIVLAAVAGGLGVTLGGPVASVAGPISTRDWLGPKEASARIEENDRQRAALLFLVGFILTLGLLSAMLALRQQ